MPFLIALPQHAAAARRLLTHGDPVHRAGLLFFRVRAPDLEAARASNPERLSRYLDAFYLLTPTRPARVRELFTRFFAAIAPQYERHIRPERNRQNIAFMLQFVRGAIGSLEGAILDYGCGPGLLVEVARSIDLTRPLVGVDSCPRMRERARARGLRTVTLGQLRRAAEPRFAAIVASYVLHLPTARDGLVDAWRALRPGGVFIGNCHKDRGPRGLTTLLRSHGGRALPVSASAWTEHGPYLAYQKERC